MSETATPEQIIEALTDAGWEVIGEQTGAYKRLALPNQHMSGYRHMLMVPLARSAPEYDLMFQALWVQLNQLRGDGQRASEALFTLARLMEEST